LLFASAIAGNKTEEWRCHGLVRPR
jgi:hypothetical protein